MQSGRVAIVTGATGALGRAVADRFRRNGDTVAGISRSGDFPADLTDPEQAAGAIRAIEARYGRIDVLVHTAGAFDGGRPFAETPLVLWQRMLDINFLSALYVCSNVIGSMQRNGRGRVVLTGSRTGLQPAPGLAAYGVSKAALHALVQALAVDLRDSGVTVNAVVPSTIDTEANRSWGSPEQAAKWTPPASIAEAIFWLASDDAADVSGALVPVYGRS